MSDINSSQPKVLPPKTEIKDLSDCTQKKPETDPDLVAAFSLAFAFQDKTQDVDDKVENASNQLPSLKRFYGCLGLENTEFKVSLNFIGADGVVISKSLLY